LAASCGNYFEKILPKKFKSVLPSIEEIERELQDEEGFQ
jgi:hypothetical protein